MEKDENKKAAVHPLWWLVYLGIVLVLLFILSTVQVLMNVRFRFGALWMGLIIASCAWLARAICRRREPAAAPAPQPARSKPEVQTEPEAAAPPVEDALAEETPAENAPADEAPTEAPAEDAPEPTAPAPSPTPCSTEATVRSSRLGITAVVLLAANLGIVCFMAFSLHELCRLSRAEPYYGQLSRMERSLDDIDSRLSRLDDSMERIRESIPSSTRYDDSSANTEELSKIRQLLNEISGYVYDLEKHSQRLESIEGCLERLKSDTQDITEILIGISLNSRRRI